MTQLYPCTCKPSLSVDWQCTGLYTGVGPSSTPGNEQLTCLAFGCALQQPKHVPVQIHPHALLFRGLAVRMAMSTGLVLATSVNPSNNRTELEGDLVRVLHALQDAPSGGQLIMDGATFAGEALPCS